MGKAAHHRRAVARFELAQARAIHQPGDDFAHVVGLAAVGGNHAVQLCRIVQWLFWRLQHHGHIFAPVEMAHNLAHLGQRFLLGVGKMVGYAAEAGVYVRPAQLLGGHFFARGRLYQRRPGQKDGAILLNDDRLVAHRRDVRPTGGTRADNGRNLNNPLARHPGNVVENPAKMLPVGEDIRLQMQKRAAGIDQVNGGQLVLLGDGLGSQMLLHRFGEVGAALHRRVVGDDHALQPGHAPHARHNARARRFTVVHLPGGQRGQLQKWAALVQNGVDAVAHQQFTP